MTPVGSDRGASASANPILIKAGARRAVTVGRSVIEIAVDGAHSEGELTSLRQALPAGWEPPLHRHMQHETTYVVSGTVEVRWLVEGELFKRRASAGTLCHIPGCHPHSVVNTDSEDALLFSFYSPAGMERFFEAAAGAPGGTAEEGYEKLLSSALAHGVELVDPQNYDAREGYRNTRVWLTETEQADPLYIGPAQVRMLARGAATESGLTVLTMEFRGDEAWPGLAHAQAKVLHVLSGRLEVGGAALPPTVLEEGDSLYVPRSTALSMRNAGEGPASLLSFITPAGLEDFVADAGFRAEGSDVPTDAEWLQRFRVAAEANGLALS
jgi:quercetin dioxygenase-like cupin family protein